jgi:CheY-like chemotaxis protein
MSRKVMIVDDELPVRFVVRKLLERNGMEVVEAEGGPRCLDLLEQGFKGVILMDIMMPEMNGWDTVREIVERGYSEDNFVFVLTALGTPDELTQHLQEYIMDYMTKPFEPEELVRTCQTYLDSLEVAAG